MKIKRGAVPPIPDIPEYVRPRPVLIFDRGGERLYASLEKNPSAKAFTAKLNCVSLTFSFRDGGCFESGEPLPWDIPQTPEKTVLRPGDVVLLEDGRIAVCREEKTGNFTKLANVHSVTDEKLLEATGGIVQGMSGSPILQNGKLIGAVTHVLVDDPTTGYAVYAETLLSAAVEISENKLKAAG